MYLRAQKWWVFNFQGFSSQLCLVYQMGIFPGLFETSRVQTSGPNLGTHHRRFTPEVYDLDGSAEIFVLNQLPGESNGNLRVGGGVWGGGGVG